MWRPDKIKVRGGVLGLAILISVLISVLSGMLLTRAQYFSYVSHIYDQRENLVRNSKSGITFLLSSQTTVLPGEIKTMDLFGYGTDSVELTRKPWGGFEIIVSKAFSHSKITVKTAMVGQTSKTDSLRTSLYLCDLDQPLSLCGNTRLDGRLFLPKAGLKRAYIEGQNYTGDKLVYGTRLDSQRDLPKINNDLIESNKKYLSGYFAQSDSVINVDGMEIPDTLIHSFSEKTLVLFSAMQINLSNVVLSGNIIIYAGKISVTNTAALKDVILYASEISVANDTQGSFQAFVSQSIEVGKNCRLLFPTVLGAIRSGAGSEIEFKPSIVVDEDSEISGEIFSYNEKPVLNREDMISIRKNVLVTGEIYINGLLDLSGSVHGSVYCQKFMLKTPSSVYENHLLNTEINAKKLPKYFTGINLLANENKKAVIQWI